MASSTKQVTYGRSLQALVAAACVLLLVASLTCQVEAESTSKNTRVGLSSLSTFAKRFWTTMASMVANDAKMKRNYDSVSSSSSSSSNSSSNRSPTRTEQQILDKTTLLLPTHSSLEDVEVIPPPAATKSPPPLPARRDSRVQKSEQQHHVSGKLELERNAEVTHDDKVLRGLTSSFVSITSKTPQGIVRTTVCNDTSVSSTEDAATVTTTPQPLSSPELDKTERPLLGHRQSSTSDTEPQVDFTTLLSSEAFSSSSPSTVESSSTGTSSSSSPPVVDITSANKVVQRKTRTRQKSRKETSSEFVQESTEQPQVLSISSMSPINDDEHQRHIETTTLAPPSTLTPNPLELETEVPLSEIFDENILNNETLLASSMSKLSSLLTSSILMHDDDEDDDTSTLVPTTTTTTTSSRTSSKTEDVEQLITTDQDPGTISSDFDFSSLFSSSDQQHQATTTGTPETSTATTSNSEEESLDYLDLTSSSEVPTGELNHNDVSVIEQKDNNLPPPRKTASLLSMDEDDGREEEGEAPDTVLVVAAATHTDNSEFQDAAAAVELVEGKTVKELNKFARITRRPVKNVTEEAGECFFNASDQKSLCDWTTDSQTSIQWGFGLGETAFMSGGPTTDSNGETNGGYVFVDTSSGFQGPSSEIQRASFQSPVLQKTVPHGRCFTFWYSIGGLSADRLRLLLIPEDQLAPQQQLAMSRMPTFTVLWERKDTTNGTWMKGEVLYTFSKQHKLIFEAFARSGNEPRRKFQGFLAVDDLAMDEDSCRGFCTFEGVLCDWFNDESDTSDDFDWELSRGSDSHLSGPVRDHGDGPEGGLMMIDTSFPRRPGDTARLNSPKFPPTDTSPVCFKFWTHMYGNGIGTLRVVLIATDPDERNVIWEVSGESGNSWHMAQVTVASSSEFQLSLEGVVGKNALGRIAIDDLSFGPGPCPSSPQSALPLRGDCTFESDECGWVNAGSGDQFDWLRTSAGQPLLPGQGPNSGYRPPEPLTDHTTGLPSGFYLTMERSTIPPRSGDQAYIVGPTLQGTAAHKCFSFWGYMHERSVDATGPGLGSLRVYLRVGTSSILRPVWRLINYEHPDWFFAQTKINTEDKFQVVIGGTWGSTRQGAISVDDFTFFDGNCSVIPTEAAVVPGECTFDSNMCDWSSAFNRTKERTSWQLATNIRRPSNLDDHTYRASAGYVFFDIFSQQPHVVRLESPDIVASNVTSNDDDNDDGGSRCLTFWFAPFGSSRNTFLRIIQRDVVTNNETQIWEVTTANFHAFRPEWIYGQVALNVTFTHKIVFEGSSSNGGFALDDIVFVPGTCQSRPEDL